MDSNSNTDPTTTPSTTATSSTSPRASGRPVKAPAQNTGRRAAVHRQIREQLQQLSTASGWQQWLRVAAHLPTYSLDNTLLIAATYPQASQLAGYEAWQSLGRQVRRGEKGIPVLAPGNGTSNERITYLWDASQTEGTRPAADPARARIRNASAQQVWDRLAVLGDGNGLALDRGSTPIGTAAVQAAQALLTGRGRDQAAGAAAATVWAAAHGLTPDSALDDLTPPAAIASHPAGIRVVAEDVLRDVRWLLAATATPTSPQDAALVHELHERAIVRLDLPTSAQLRDGDVVPAPATAGAADPDPGVLIAVHREALRFYRAQLPESWALDYLAERLPGIDPDTIAAGVAPSGWTSLTKHLRAAGYTDEAIAAAGLAARASHGGLVDRFRDRLVLPIRGHDGTVIAFVGRARPGTEDEKTPKYLNSPTTALYRKAEIVYGLAEAAPHLPRRPMLVPVEGPLDALAVTYGTAGRAVGLAPLGTAWTPDHVAAIHNAAPLHCHDVIVATDNDAAGIHSAAKLYELLTAHGSDPRHADLRAGEDPAARLATHGSSSLIDALTRTRPLSHTLIEHAVQQAAPDLDRGWVEQRVAATRAAVGITAALPPPVWERDLAHIVSVTGVHPSTARHELQAAYLARSDNETGITAITATSGAAPARAHRVATLRAEDAGRSARAPAPVPACTERQKVIQPHR